MSGAAQPDLPTPGPALFRLDGRVAIVTGGARGLGEAIARGFARAGAAVVLADLDGDTAAATAAAIATNGARALAVAVDVRDRSAVEALVDRTVAAFGRLDILVNSAGISARGPALDYDPERFRAVFEVNVLGTFLCCQAAARVMLPAGRGSIVNIASIAGLVGYPGNPAYLTSKGGVVQLTRALAMEWAPAGLRVNAIAPGVIDTEPLRRQVEAEPAFYVAFRNRHPLGRFGQVGEVVGPALFLASDASTFVTGHILAVDGGYTAQ